MNEMNFDPEEWKSWDEATKRRMMQMIESAQIERRYWFCKRGRDCGGKPHDGYEYNHARPDQWPPPGTDWFVWLVMSGRGAGKTRTGSEWVRKITSHVERIALVGRRGPDVRGTMVEGKSGLIAICERAGVDYEWLPSKKEFRFGNGAKAYGYSAEEPDTLRGPEHGAAWLDEPAHMPLITDVWDNLLMGLRIDGLPGGAKALCTSTPLPLKWLKELRLDPTTRTVRVPTHVNLDNLDPNFRRNIIEKYEGTRRGRQELYGEILEDVEGALWTITMIEQYRRTDLTYKDMDRVVVAIDPSGTSTKNRDETGIVVVGKLGREYFVLADRSGHYTPEGWAAAAWKAYDDFEADKVIAEKNYGGEMVMSTLRNHRPDGPAKLVHSRRGKQLRAEPIAALYEQGRVHHTDIFTKKLGEEEGLEEQMTEWVPGASDSPDRVDALVHGITELTDGDMPVQFAAPKKSTGRGRQASSMRFGSSTSRLTMGRNIVTLPPRTVVSKA